MPTTIDGGNVTLDELLTGDGPELTELVGNGLLDEDGALALLGHTDVLVFSDGSEAVAADASGVIARNAAHGAVIQQAHDAISGGDTLRIAPGSYSCQDVSRINTGNDVDGASILADGAIIDTKYYVRSKRMAIDGLTVSGAPGDGFHWNRGQWGYYRGLRAYNCGGKGFAVGTTDNDQVAFSTWDTCFAQQNTGYGWHLAGPTNSFANANTFINPVSRDNGDIGFVIEGTANYNEFFSHQTESNTGTTDIYVDANENSFFGGHTVGDIIQGPNGRATLVLGGRHTGTVDVGDYWIPSNVRNTLSYRGTLNDGANVNHTGELADEPVVNFLPASEVSVTEASDSTTGHVLHADLSSVLGEASDAVYLNVHSYGRRDLNDDAGQAYSWQFNTYVTHDASSTSWQSGTAVAESDATITNATVSQRQLEITFDTNNVTPQLFGEVRLQQGRG